MKEASHKEHMLCDSIYLKCPEKANKSIGTESWWGVARGLEAGGKWALTTSGCRASFWGDENVLKLEYSDGRTAL